MPYPAQARTLAQWLIEIDQRMIVVRREAESQKTISTAGQLNMLHVRNFYDLLASANAFFTSVAAVPGIGAYIADQKQGLSPDPVADAQAVQAAIVNTLAWLRTNTPGATVAPFGTWKLAVGFPADNTSPSTLLTFTSQQTNGYRTVLDSLIATIG